MKVIPTTRRALLIFIYVFITITGSGTLPLLVDY